eukprot:Filipodium_phascolosomae@DN6958_c0_g1_i1.p1
MNCLLFLRVFMDSWVQIWLLIIATTLVGAYSLPSWCLHPLKAPPTKNPVSCHLKELVAGLKDTKVHDVGIDCFKWMVHQAISAMDDVAVYDHTPGIEGNCTATYQIDAKFHSFRVSYDTRGLHPVADMLESLTRCSIYKTYSNKFIGYRVPNQVLVTMKLKGQCIENESDVIPNLKDTHALTILDTNLLRIHDIAAAFRRKLLQKHQKGITDDILLTLDYVQRHSSEGLRDSSQNYDAELIQMMYACVLNRCDVSAAPVWKQLTGMCLETKGRRYVSSIPAFPKIVSNIDVPGQTIPAPLLVKPDNKYLARWK